MAAAVSAIAPNDHHVHPRHIQPLASVSVIGVLLLLGAFLSRFCQERYGKSHIQVIAFLSVGPLAHGRTHDAALGPESTSLVLAV